VARTRAGPTALRFRVSDAPSTSTIMFRVRRISISPPAATVVERRDRLASYQIAVVVDDAFQEVTRVVRGADLSAQHALADRSPAGAVAAPAYLRTPAACSERTAPNYRNPSDQCRSTCRRHPLPSFRPLRICRRPHPPNWPTLLLKRCGNGPLGTGTHERLRAKPTPDCPPKATRSRIAS
jgi:hypothetical protein